VVAETRSKGSDMANAGCTGDRLLMIRGYGVINQKMKLGYLTIS
jgi:hypothetical protein